ncbi:MAG: NAD(P)-binding protein [Symploca sp. SIO2E9]|nr:NAD(P)-binding protein [Symploca sp. SIO2E9]
MQELAPTYDAIIIGCGLAGLFTSLRLQQIGLNVLLLDRRDIPGGLCGTKIIDDYEFVIACNDFGRGMEKDIEELNIPVTFKSKKTRIHYNNEDYFSPFDRKTIFEFLSHPIAFSKFILKLKNNKPKQVEDYYLGAIVDKLTQDKTLKDLLKLPSYMMGLPPQYFLLEAINYDSFYGYGYLDPRTPDGGPQVLVDTLVKTFTNRGGSLVLNTECRQIKQVEKSHKVITNQGEFYSPYVISSQPRLDKYPPGYKPGMKLSKFCIAVAKDLPFPEDIHTIIYYPPGISDWYEKLDAGELVSEFGFHIFKSDLPEKSDHYTMNIYFYLPRDMDRPTAEVVEEVENYIFTKLESLVPGLNQALKYKKFISPEEFSQIHQGLSSRVTPVVMTHDFKKPDNYDPETDIYYIGNSVYPPGDHAGASLLSAKTVANLIQIDWQQNNQVAQSKQLTKIN